MSVLRRVGILRVALDVREPYQGINSQDRPYELVSFLGDGKVYVGSAAIRAAMSGDADALDVLIEGEDYCIVSDLNVVKFRQGNDEVFPIISALRRGQLVRVEFHEELVIGNGRKVWRENVVGIEIVSSDGVGARSRSRSAASA